MKKILTLLTLLALNFISMPSNIVRADDTSHFYDTAYQCLSTHTSKQSGKEFTTLHYYHPGKNWLIKLSAVKQKSLVKVVNLYTPEGRYDGEYSGVYPEIKNIKFVNFWPNKETKDIKVSSKLEKSDCQLLTNSSVFDLPYLASLECMDPIETGICKSIKR